MKILAVFGRSNYGKADRGISYEYANFFPALEKLGHKVEFFESWDRSKYKNFTELNIDLLKKIESMAPDIVFLVVYTYEIWLESLKAIMKYTDAAVISWGTDDSWKFRQCSRYIAPYVDIHATTDEKTLIRAKKYGVTSVVKTQWAADSTTLTKPIPAKECRYQVTFVGTAYGKRSKYIYKLKETGFNIECFGYGWPNGPVSMEEVRDIYLNSAISLNFSGSFGLLPKIIGRVSSQIKARTFEVPGAGGFLLTEYAHGIEEYYEPEQEIVTFIDLDDLIKKIGYYLSRQEERDYVSRKGFQKTKTSHTYIHRFQWLLEEARSRARLRHHEDNASSKSLGDEINRLSENWNSIRTSIALQLVKRMVMTTCSALFGKDKGPRAARRIVYEVSWRCFGEKTYSPESLPGRLFYKES